MNIKSNFLKNPLLIVLCMEVPLNDARVILCFILTAIECLSTESENDVFAGCGRYFLQSETLAREIFICLFDDYCPIFVRVISEGKAET